MEWNARQGVYTGRRRDMEGGINGQWYIEGINVEGVAWRVVYTRSRLRTEGSTYNEGYMRRVIHIMGPTQRGQTSCEDSYIQKGLCTYTGECVRSRFGHQSQNRESARFDQGGRIDK